MITPNKKSNFRITFSIVGIIIGLLTGLGIINQIKKSQRENIIHFSLISCSIIGLLGGYKVGDKFDTDELFDELLGINRAEIEYFKNGRSWIIRSKWSDYENKNYILITKQDFNKMLISQLNESTTINHEIQSGSKINVEKHHQIAKNYFYNKLRSEIENNSKIK